jgi:virginiamycin B lyase
MTGSAKLTRAFAGCASLLVAASVAGAQAAANAATNASAQAVAAANGDPITQWKVPFTGERNGRSRDAFVAPDGRVFFVDQVANFLGAFDPKSAMFTKFEIPPGTLPHTNIITPDGIVWLAGNGNGTIVRFDPKTNATKVFPVSLEGATRPTDPHTMMYDGKGGIWFTSQQSHFVGHFDIASGQVRTVRTSTPPQRTNPYGIILDDKGHPWFDLLGTNKIGTINPQTMELKTYTLPDSARPRRIGRTSDGAIWYTDWAKCKVGRLDPATGNVDEYASPTGGNCGPYAMAVDDADRVWWTDTRVFPNRLIAIDGKTRKVVYNYEIPGGKSPNSVRHMVFDPKTRQIWYGADQNFLGSVKVPPKPIM